jgi:hypothetical protein
MIGTTAQTPGALHQSFPLREACKVSLLAFAIFTTMITISFLVPSHHLWTGLFGTLVIATYLHALLPWRGEK